MQLLKAGFVLSNLALLASAVANDTTSCPGYAASNVQQSGTTLTADLTLAGTACNSYGTDLQDLKLLVEYQTGIEHYSNRIGAAWLTLFSRHEDSRQDLRCRGKCVSSTYFSLS